MFDIYGGLRMTMKPSVFRKMVKLAALAFDTAGNFDTPHGDWRRIKQLRQTGRYEL